MKIHDTEPRPAGFSLIEVTIAIAITALGLVAIMGMIPQGMQAMRDATDRAVEARIHQQVLGEVLLTEWEKRDKYDYRKAADELRYYDDQGIEVAKGDPDFDRLKVYTARVHVPSLGDLLPGSMKSGSYSMVYLPGNEVTDEVQLVIVEITAVQGEEDFDFDDSNNFSRIKAYESTVARMGQDFVPISGP